jgi:hypothetical protein
MFNLLLMPNFGISFLTSKILVPITFCILGFSHLTSSNIGQRRENAVICKVDGRGLKAGGESFLTNSLEVTYRPAGSLRIKGKELKKDSDQSILTSLDLYIASVDKPGEYLLGANTLNLGAYFSSLSASSTYFSTDPYHTGTVRITKIDKENKVIAGDFEFIAASNHDLNQTVSITKGRFNLQYE